MDRKSVATRVPTRAQACRCRNGAEPVFEKRDDAGTGHRSVDAKVRRATDPYGQWPLRLDQDDLSIALEFPWRDGATGEATADAGVAEELSGMFGSAELSEIRRGGGGCETLGAWPDGHCNHILLETLIITDTCIAACRQNINEAFIGDDFEVNIWIGCEKR